MKKLGMLLIVTSFMLVLLPVAASADPGPIETVTVDASNINGIDSTTVLTLGVNYRFEAMGIWQDTSKDNHYIDTEYTTFDAWTSHMDGTTNWGPNQKDLQVDETFVDWGAYDGVNHTYSYFFTGTGSSVNFRVYDGPLPLPPELKWYTDNIGTITVNIYETLIEVDVDIKPTSCPNPLNVNSMGVLPVAILGTEDFDVTTIDPASVQLEGLVAPLRWSYEDAATPYSGSVADCLDCTTEGPDGFMDLALKFDTQEVVAALGPVEDGDCPLLHLTGQLLDGTSFSGEDVVKIIKKGP